MPQGIFISVNNTVYVSNHQYGAIRVWLPGSTNPTSIIDGSFNGSKALFVSTAGDVYFSNDYPFDRVSVWKANSGSFMPTLSIVSLCLGLFIDINDSLYCSLYVYHQVIKRSLNSTGTQFTIVAGKSCQGYTSDMLSYPHGIFVAINFDLYVADTSNHRIQLFPAGQLNGTTVAGSEALGTIQFSNPTAVVLDADNYVFIVDWGNQRIVGSGPNGFRCVLGCASTSGAASDQLYFPRSMAF